MLVAILFLLFTKIQRTLLVTNQITTMYCRERIENRHLASPLLVMSWKSLYLATELRTERGRRMSTLRLLLMAMSIDDQGSESNVEGGRSRAKSIPGRKIWSKIEGGQTIGDGWIGFG